ncbi:MAG: S8 family serine peptidase [Candidatus Glassbacteria bacterium]
MCRVSRFTISLLTSSGFILVFTASRLFGGSIDPAFQSKVTSAAPDTYLSAIVMMAQQLDLEVLDVQLTAQKASRQLRHERVVRELKKTASGTQVQVNRLMQLAKERGDVESYRAHWVANLFTVKAKPGFLIELSERFDVGVIYEDIPIYLIESVGEGTEAEPNGVEWGLRMIHADSIWAGGGTGGGRIVCNLDTGVDGSHPALSGSWRGNDPGVTPQEAWFDPYNGTTFPVDNASHGTHTMGTMVGADHATGDTVGVAFGAKWIAANVFEDPQTTSSAFMQAFEWTIDPDGDPSTIDDVPDVVSNSWGSSDPACFQQYWRVIDANEAAGVAIVFSAGNSGPGSRTIISPASRATTPFNVFAVGAVNSSSNIASFSSRGPSPCDSVSIKPEVVAPGVSVRSTVPGGGYSSMSGTSMSSPHVGGAIALLRQVSPNATVDEIKEALIATAVDLGTAGEDNTYGNGLIDLAAAARYLIPISQDPYIVYSGTTVDDGNNGVPEPGEAINLISYLGNMGQDVTGVSATLHSSDPFVQINSGSSVYGDISGGSVADNSTNPFAITLSDSTPGSRYLDFVLDIEGDGGAYTTQLEFSLQTPFEVLLADHDVGNVIFSVSDAGRFGFDNLDQENGSGFIFPIDGNNWLFEGALLIGMDEVHVSHSARGTPAGPVETDWQVSPGGNIIIEEPGAVADEEGTSTYTDIGAPNPIDLQVIQKSFAFAESPDDDYVIVSLLINSLSPDTSTFLEDLYVAMYMDWDVGITNSQIMNNEGNMSRQYDLGYMYREESPEFPHVGVSVLTEPGMVSYQLINNQDGSYQFSRSEFYQTMSGGFQDTLRMNGDYSYVISTGPFSLSGSDTLSVAFAVLAGEDLDDLVSNVEAARLKWLEITGGVGVDDPFTDESSRLPKSYGLSQNYPNPFNPQTSISFSIADEDGDGSAVATKLRVFNMRGQLVRTLIDKNLAAGSYKASWDGKDESGLPVSSGVYIYTLEAGSFRTQRKMVLLR